MNQAGQNIANLPARTRDTGAHLVEFDPHTNAYVPDNDIDLRSLWQIIVKHRGTIATLLLLTVITTIAATLLMRPVYRSSAMLEIKPESGNIVKFQNLEQTSYQPQEYKTTQQNIILSESVAEAVIKRLNLAEDPEMSGQLVQRGFVTGLKQLVEPVLMLAGGDSPAAEDEDHKQNRRRLEILERFKSRISVFPIKNSDLFLISFDSFSPKLAAEGSNAIVEEYMRLSQDRKFGSTSGAKEFLQREIARVQATLESSEEDLTDFARKNKIVDVEEKDDIMTRRLGDLNEQLTIVNGERFTAEARYKQATSGAGIDTLPMVLSNELIQNLKKQYAVLQGEYFNLAKIYKPAYPKLQQLQAEMDRTNQTIGAETNRILGGIKSQYEQLKEKEVLLAEQLEKQKVDLLELKDRSIQYNILKREWESNKQLYSGLLERMKEVGVAAGMEVNNISVIDRAIVPVDKYKPNLKLNILLASIFGLSAGLGLAFLLAYLDNTVRNPEELERYVAVSSLGIIPKIRSRSKKDKRGNSQTAKLRNRLDLISHFERENEISEAFRSIRTSLMFSTPTGMPKTLQVTSTGSGEGKTTIALNLAAVLADNGSKVLLVDADLRKPRLHKVFKIPTSPGLSEFLTGQVDSSPIHKTKIDRLSIVASGTPPPNPAELLGSEAMVAFIEQMSSLHDHVIIDSAPLLGLADSVILATRVDAILYTVLAGQVSRDGLREGIKRLRRVNAPVVGAILNQVNMDEGSYQYYRDNYYSYAIQKGVE